MATLLIHLWPDLQLPMNLQVDPESDVLVSKLCFACFLHHLRGDQQLLGHLGLQPRLELEQAGPQYV